MFLLPEGLCLRAGANELDALVLLDSHNRYHVVELSDSKRAFRNPLQPIAASLGLQRADQTVGLQDS